jgi:hypothetical protein
VDPESELLGDEPVRLPRSRRAPEPRERREPWHPSRWLVVTAVLAVLLALVAVPLWQADRRAEGHEAAVLDTCRRVLRTAAVSSDLEMTAVAANLRPTLARTTGARHAATVRVLSNPARAALPAVVRADRLCRSVSVRPWHRSLRARSEAATRYSGALVARLRAVVADGSAYFHDARPLRRLRSAADLGVVGGRW